MTKRGWDPNLVDLRLLATFPNATIVLMAVELGARVTRLWSADDRARPAPGGVELRDVTASRGEAWLRGAGFVRSEIRYSETRWRAPRVEVAWTWVEVPLVDVALRDAHPRFAEAVRAAVAAGARLTLEPTSASPTGAIALFDVPTSVEHLLQGRFAPLDPNDAAYGGLGADGWICSGWPRATVDR